MRTSVVAALAVTSLLNLACATKNYVRYQVAPLIKSVNDLDDRTGQNTRDLKDVDNRVTQKLNMLFSGIAETSRNIGSIERRGVAAQAATADTITKLKSFETSLLSRENYRSLAEKSVQFRLGEKILTPQSRETLDEFVASIPKALNYLIVVEGSTDASGPQQYNNVLSQQRAEAVVRYLASKHDIPSYRMRWIGVGVNKPAAPNNTLLGRAQNRRANAVLLIRIFDTPFELYV